MAHSPLHNRVRASLATGRWHLVRWLLRNDARRAAQSLGPVGQYDLDSQALISEEQLQLEERWLRNQLRRLPYWRIGHIEMARRALQRGDAAQAYAAALASATLAVGDSQKDESDHLLAKSLLLAGDAYRAVPLLEALSRAEAPKFSVYEDLAASYLALDRHRDALLALQEIPEHQMSPSMSEAFRYLKSKLVD